MTRILKKFLWKLKCSLLDLTCIESFDKLPFHMVNQYWDPVEMPYMWLIT